MQIISYLIDLFLHLDKYLEGVISAYGVWTYALLFAIIFMETGLVITPFLPGDSLLFAAGALAARGWLNIWVLLIVCSAAAILGDTVNYWIGHFIGPKAFSGDVPFLKKEYMDRTHAFYEKHGGKTIVLARFIPIIRTFAPFVAGVGAMSYGKFISYNVVGGILWVTLFVWLGYFFGNLPFVRDNFSFIVVAIIIISVLPAVYEVIRQKLRPAEKSSAESTPTE